MNSPESSKQNSDGTKQNGQGQQNSEVSDYYELLGVDRNATQEQIKKGYKKMALKYHPDRGGDAEMFKKVSQAYSVLSDPEKKQVYDEYGENGLKGDYGETYEDFDPFDIFGSFFGGDDDFGGFMNGFNFFDAPRGRKKTRGYSKPADIVQQLDCSLEDIYLGSKRSVSFKRQVICKKCGGNGCSKSVDTTCKRCKGRGVEVKVIKQRGFVQQTSSPCRVCHGSGTFVDPKDRCSTCRGRGLLKVTKSCEVEIPRGATNGEEIRVKGMGDEAVGGKAGDAVFVIRELPSKSFIRKDNNLITTLSISLAEALCGFSRVIVMPDNRKLRVSVPVGSVIHPNSVKVIYGEGMPAEHTYKGDLIVRFEVQFPDTLSEEEVKKLEMSFNYKREEPSKEDVMEEVSLCDFDPSRYPQSRRGSMDGNTDSQEEIRDYSFDGSNQQNCTIL